MEETSTAFRMAPLPDMFARRGTYTLRRNSTSRGEIAHNTVEFEPRDALFGDDRRRSCGCCRSSSRLFYRHRRSILTFTSAIVTFTVMLLLIGSISYNLSFKISAALKTRAAVESKPENRVNVKMNIEPDTVNENEGESVESLTPVEAEPSHRRTPIEVLEDSREFVKEELPMVDVRFLSDSLSRAIRRYRRSLPRVGSAASEDVQQNLNQKLDAVLQEILSYKAKLLNYEQFLKKYASVPFYEFPKLYPTIKTWPPNLLPVNQENTSYNYNSKTTAVPLNVLEVTGTTVDYTNVKFNSRQEFNSSEEISEPSVKEFATNFEITTEETTESVNVEEREEQSSSDYGSISTASDNYEDMVSTTTEPNVLSDSFDLLDRSSTTEQSLIDLNEASEYGSGVTESDVGTTLGESFSSESYMGTTEGNVEEYISSESYFRTTPVNLEAGDSQKVESTVGDELRTTESEAEIFSTAYFTESTSTENSPTTLIDLTPTGPDFIELESLASSSSESPVTDSETTNSELESTIAEQATSETVEAFTSQSTESELFKLSDMEAKSGLEKEIMASNLEETKGTSTLAPTSAVRTEIRGVSLQEARNNLKAEFHRQKWNSRVVTSSDSIKLPTGPDTSVAMGESISTGQQISFSPSVFPSVIVPYEVCFYGNPNSNSRGPSIRDDDRQRTFDFHLPGFPAYPSFGLPTTTDRPTVANPTQTVVNVFMNNYPTHVTAPAAPMPVPGTYMFPSQQHMARYFNGQQQQQPLFCSQLQPPMYQFPTIPGSADYGHRRCLNCEGSSGLLGAPNHSNRIQEEELLTCPEGTSGCKDNQLCIPSEQWCDGRIHCLDSSDELFCSCRDRVADSRHCDGFPDCPHGEDETGCLDCGPMEFSCGTMDQKTSCIPVGKRCDGLEDCTNGSDEEGCSVLTSPPHSNTSNPVSYAEGFLMTNWRGTWYPVCNEKGRQLWAERACTDATDSDNGDIEVEHLGLPDSVKGPYLVHQEDGNFIVRHHCKGHVGMYVRCPPPRCGTRVTFSEHDMEQKEFVDRFRRLVEHKDAPSISDRPFVSWWEKVTEDVAKEFDVRDVRAQLVPLTNLFGRKKRQESSRVVGGRQSSPHAWPWAVALYRDGYFHCGGAVLDSQWIVTAAHCVSKFWEHYYEVRIGMLRRNSYSPMEQVRSISHVIVHEKYDPNSMKNDLAVLRLSHPVRYSRWVRPICLPVREGTSREGPGGPAPGSQCVAVGWGALKEHGHDPDQLREVEVPIMERCKHREDVEGEEICAGFEKGGKDTCQGDSGGPLMCRDSANAWYIAGVVSHGEGCARPDEPGAYTRVSLYIDWLATHTDENLPPEIPRRDCPGFKCHSHPQMCLPERLRCNGLADCFDGEDEISCSPFKSDDNEFTEKPVAYETDSLLKELNEERIMFKELFNYSVVLNTSRPFQCKRVVQSVPGLRRCDGVHDCEDGSDEWTCLCRDQLIRERPQAICDGTVDCADVSDERNCFDCPEDYFNCRKSRQCIHITRKCNLADDCVFGEDEANCLALTSNFYVNIEPNGEPKYETQGILVRNVRGMWRVICTNETSSRRYPAKMCADLGLAGYEKFSSENYTEFSLDNSDTSMGLLSKTNIKRLIECNVMEMSCSKYLRNIPKVINWDWEARIYINGQYSCTGLLLTNDWLLASTHCISNATISESSYIAAELGRKVYPPKFVRIIEARPLPFTNVMILKLERSVVESRNLRPIQLPMWISSDELKTCYAMGPDSHVELKKSDEICGNGQICLTRKKRPIRGCTSAPWIGVVVCRSDKGWTPLSAYHEIGGECGFQSATFTNILENVKPIETILGSSVPLEPLDSPRCDGHRCLGGMCLVKSNVCDGWPQCPFGDDEDEAACNSKLTSNDCYLKGLRCDDSTCIPWNQFGQNLAQCTEINETSCKDYLELTTSRRVCDGHRNCLDKSDEDFEICGCQTSSHRCNGSQKCIPKDFVCDGFDDCPNGDDEQSCYVLKRASRIPNVYRVENISYGVMHSACNISLTLEEADRLCQGASYKKAAKLEAKRITPDFLLLDPFTTIKFNNATSISVRGDRPLVTVKKSKQLCHGLFLTCLY